MCEHREHRFNMTIKDLENKVEHKLTTYAKGLSQAIARGDAWAHLNLPKSRDAGKYGNGPDASVAIEITCHRVGYSSREVAEEHGADFVFEDKFTAYRSEIDEAELLAKFG